MEHYDCDIQHTYIDTYSIHTHRLIKNKIHAMMFYDNSGPFISCFGCQMPLCFNHLRQSPWLWWFSNSSLSNLRKIIVPYYYYYDKLPVASGDGLGNESDDR